MIYSDWQSKYKLSLKNKIKSNVNSISYTLEEIDKLIDELCERGFLDEDGYWQDVTPETAANESYQLWLNDYFC